MSRQVYPRYKTTGIEWLAEIPEHWEAKRLRFLLSEPLKYGANESAELDDPDLPRYIRITDVHENGRLREDTFKSLPEDVAYPYLLKEGDLLFARSGATVGKSFYYESSWGRAAYAGYLIRARFNAERMMPRFINYFTNSHQYWQWLGLSFIQATIQNVSAEKYANLVVTVPAIYEQRAIAAFLDRETARIDALIEKKRTQAELLQEKRTALISHTVTKGLNPNAKMKDSGIGRLGQIPEGWEVKRIKHLGAIRYGLGEPPEYVDEGLPFIRATDIKRGKIDLDTVRKVRREDVPWSRRPTLQIGEILVVRSGAYAGDSAIVTEDVEGCIAGYDMILTITYAHAPFVAWVLLSKYMLQGQIYLERMRAAQPHLNAEELGGFVILMPPLAEQLQIAKTLSRETDKLDALADKINGSIEMLREHRTALISAAVTGKIDVRDSIEQHPKQFKRG
ncbi:MAG TPA: restriction endonuclease subunit S [Acidobacteriota bacterium]|mgnify:CR=1 FL=1|nr:restriction endonuclease subunit S [Acidobacteriota bacterium]